MFKSRVRSDASRTDEMAANKEGRHLTFKHSMLE